MKTAPYLNVRFLDNVYPEKILPNSKQREFSNFFIESLRVEYTGSVS